MKKALTLKEMVRGLNRLLKEGPVVLSTIILTGYPDPSTLVRVDEQGVLMQDNIEESECKDVNHTFHFNVLSVLCSLYMEAGDDEFPIQFVVNKQGVIQRFFLFLDGKLQEEGLNESDTIH